MNATSYAIAPNKRGSIKLCAILTPALLALGAAFVFFFQGEIFEIFHVVRMRAELMGVVIAALSVIPILIMIHTLRSKRRIVLDESRITLSETVSFGWDEISYCYIKSYLGRPFLLHIVLASGPERMISWNQVDCGLEKLADLICEHISDGATDAD